MHVKFSAVLGVICRLNPRSEPIILLFLLYAKDNIYYVYTKIVDKI